MNFSIIELLLIGFSVWMGISKKPPVSVKTATMIIAGALLLLLFIGGTGALQDSPLTGFGLTLGGFNFMFLGIVAAILYWIVSLDAKGKPAKFQWFGLAAVFFLSADASTNEF